MDYKFLPDPKKMLPKVFFAKSNLELFKPSEEILRIKREETFKT
jgi:CRISPR-associated protein Cpf1